MARKKNGRFLSDQADSEDFWEIQRKHGHEAGLLWAVFLIPNADRYGCIKGSPSHLARRASQVIYDFSADEIDNILRTLEKRNMITRVVSTDGTEAPGIRLLNFHRHQIGMRPDREAESIFEPPGWIDNYVKDALPKGKAKAKRPAKAPSTPEF